MTLDETLQKLKDQTSELEQVQQKIQDTMDEIITAMGISEIKLKDHRDFDDSEIRVISIKDMDGKELLDSKLSWSDLTNTFDSDYMAVEELEPKNSINFIAGDSISNKYKLITDEQLEELDEYTYVRLARHFLQRDIPCEKAGEFLERLFDNRECIPYFWWED